MPLTGTPVLEAAQPCQQDSDPQEQGWGSLSYLSPQSPLWMSDLGEESSINIKQHQT